MFVPQRMDPFLEEFFKINRYLITPIGGWPFSASAGIEIFKLFLGHTHNVMSVLVAAVETMELVENLDNIFRTIEGICVVITAFLCILKNLPMNLQRKFMRTLFMSLNEIYMDNPVMEANGKIDEINEQAKNQAQFIAKGLFAMYLSPMILYMCFPWWHLFRHNELIFPFPSKFPFDTSTIKSYLAPYMLEFIMGFGLIFIFAGIETMFSSLIIYLCSRIEILDYCLQIATTEAIAQGRTTPLFGRCIVYHKNILRACEAVEKYYSPLLVVQFLFSTVVVCMLCFLSTQTTLDNEKNAVYLSYFICMIFQLYIYNYFGQLIQNKCNALSYSGFHCPWYEAPVSYQKDLCFYLLRCRKQFIFTAYKVMPVNLETFFAIIKTSMSYYTILVSMKDDAK